MATATAPDLPDTHITYRLVLVGKTGSGKSSTGNTILGYPAFATSLGSRSVTKGTQRAEARISDVITVEVVDTAGIFDTQRTNEDVCNEVFQALKNTRPGPNAILYVVDGSSRYTKEEYATYIRLKAIFGENVTSYMIVIITRGDELDFHEMSLDTFLETATCELKKVVRECSKRCLKFNNRVQDTKPPQNWMLLSAVAEMDYENGHAVFQTQNTSIKERLQQVEAEEMMKTAFGQQLLADNEQKEMLVQAQAMQLQESMEKLKSAEQEMAGLKKQVKDQRRAHNMKFALDVARIAASTGLGIANVVVGGRSMGLELLSDIGK